MMTTFVTNSTNSKRDNIGLQDIRYVVGTYYNIILKQNRFEYVNTRHGLCFKGFIDNHPFVSILLLISHQLSTLHETTRFYQKNNCR